MKKNLAPGQIEYTRICFVIMPFKKKNVDGIEVDFDWIYDNIFMPAIAEVALPQEEGGGYLIPKRADKDYASGNIDIEMFQYLEYSRFALVDITGLNANVFYELGIRHHANHSGTAIFRQADKVIPFDISHIKAFPYEYDPAEKVKESKELIVKILTNSLKDNRIDSPVQIALGAQRLKGDDINPFLIKATNALRNDDFITAIVNYKQALLFDPKNSVLRLELGLLFRKLGKWEDAMNAFEKATSLSEKYGEAWRELGIAQNKIYYQKNNEELLNGEQSLLKAIELNPDDYDAYASLGGLYKREMSYDLSIKMYQESITVSNGHPYPLLNYITLKVHQSGYNSLVNSDTRLMKRAEIPLKKQAAADPPYNSPWCFFDLSSIYMFMKMPSESYSILKQGIELAEGWEIKTHLETLNLLQGHEIEGLNEAIALLTAHVN